MATYGPGSTAGFVAFTGFTPTLGGVNAVDASTSGFVQFNGMGQQDGKLSLLLSRGPDRIMRELILTLLGVVAGSTALETRSQVTAVTAVSDAQQMGGLVTIGSRDLVNRVTVAGDITNVAAALSRTPILTYVADASGNGGGGHGGY
jgi:hypothetical protein